VKAWLNLRYTVPDRLKAFVAGIERHGYKAEIGFPDRIGPKDLFLTWNRINMGNVIAQKFQDQGLPVIVAENAAWGNDFLGRRWYSIARNYHNTAGCTPFHGCSRWDALGVELEPHRPISTDVLILPQRGIGSPPTRMPAGWLNSFQGLKWRVRPHPGKREAKSLREDLEGVSCVYTWGSGAAIKAAMWGCVVVSEMPNWIGQHEGTLSARLEMFRRLAWAQWELHEIESGEAFACLLPA
jgi:hypothetical protein